MFFTKSHICNYYLNVALIKPSITSYLFSFYGQYNGLNYKPVENTTENKGSPGDKDLSLALLVLCCHNLFLLHLGDGSVYYSSRLVKSIRLPLSRQLSPTLLSIKQRNPVMGFYSAAHR